jgi:hypothetical protein
MLGPGRLHRVSLLVRGRIHSGPLTADFSYLDTRGEFGLITELIWRVPDTESIRF